MWVPPDIGWTPAPGRWHVTTNRHRWIARAEAWIRVTVEASGWDSCVVVNAQQIVLGRLRREVLAGNLDEVAGDRMDPDPTTVRANEPLVELLQRMEDRGVESMIVTTAEGHLIGVLRRHDAAQRLASWQYRVP
jgi:CBS domain-containing protein